MPELTLPLELADELAEIYAKLEEDYRRVAGQISLGCEDCLDNCCDSWFFHHTYCEWAWLWQGLRQLEAEALARIVRRAEDYLRQSQAQLAAGQRPQLICPLNDNGLCGLYEHRLLVCRMHGVPAVLTRPDGQHLRFPGCFRCQEIVRGRYASEDAAPAMDRTQLFTRLADVETRLLGGSRQRFPKVKKTIAEMIALGPPVIGQSFSAK
ncbi:hypothetical protein [Candidatus Electronema sp. JC]|uniref:hypothetical protein n=1 Tax=Candidatus Electronema sp. JC TaxID=3401570 RepID=UPI003B4316FC